MNFLIPDIHQSGLMWFHSHAHSLTSQQVNSGLSGAIIIKGNEDYYGQFSKPKGPLLVQQKGELESPSDREEFQANSLSPEITQQVMLFKDFTNKLGETEEDCFLLNSQVNPQITIRPGEIQLWRVGNIGSEKYMNIALEKNNIGSGDNNWDNKIEPANNVPGNNDAQNYYFTLGLTEPQTDRVSFIRLDEDGNESDDDPIEGTVKLYSMKLNLSLIHI